MYVVGPLKALCNQKVFSQIWPRQADDKPSETRRTGESPKDMGFFPLTQISRDRLPQLFYPAIWSSLFYA